MTLSAFRIEALQNKFQSPQALPVSLATDKVHSTVMRIQELVDAPVPGSAPELEFALGTLSEFFRTAKFTTLMLPVLNSIAQMDADMWKTAINPSNNTSLTPESFENMSRSTGETRDDYGRILTKFVREREVALLSVYGITLQRIQEAMYTGRSTVG
jgi:hypothetical protein